MKTISKNKSSKIKEQSKLFTAIHESGHALIGWYHGLTLHSVSIQAGQLDRETEFDGISKSYFPESGRVESVNHRMFTAPRVLELLAGRAATDLLCPDIPPGYGHRHDFETVKNLFALDQDVLSMHSWRIQHPEAGTEAFYQNFKTSIYKIISSKRGNRSIKALSHALLKSGQLSGREAARILSKSWGKPLPPWTLPTEQHKAMVEEGPQTFNDLMSKILVYMRIIKKEILPFCDADENTPSQNAVIQRFADSVLLIQFLALGQLSDEKTASKPS